MIKYITEEDYARELKTEPMPVLLNVWNNGSTLSKRMSNTVQAMAQRFKGKVKVMKIRAEEYDDFSMDFGVFEYPAFIFLHRGKELSRAYGFIDHDVMVKEVTDHLGQLW